jgi:hypothetical protein
LEPNACNLTCVFPIILQFLYFCKLILIILQFLYFCKLILEYKEIPLHAPWRRVVVDISREYVRMTVGSRNRTFIVFASAFEFFGRFVFGGRLGEMVAELGRGLYVAPNVLQLFTYARTVDVSLQHVRLGESGEAAVAPYPETTADAYEYLRRVLPRKRGDQGYLWWFLHFFFFRVERECSILQLNITLSIFTSWSEDATRLSNSSFSLASPRIVLHQFGCVYSYVCK